MAQYKTGTASVTNGSAVVTGSGTLWSSNVNVGDGFVLNGVPVPYTVASVDSNTQLTLSAPWAGSTTSGSVYAIFRDFTTNEGLPELSRGDIETATIWTRALRLIDAFVQRATAAATTTTLGTVEKATTTEAEAATADKFPDAAGVHEAFNQYGLGVDSTLNVFPSGDNFNTLDPTGVYNVSDSTANNPPQLGTSNFTGVCFHTIRNSTSSSSRAHQFLITDLGRAFFRSNVNATWGEWNEVLNGTPQIVSSSDDFNDLIYPGEYFTSSSAANNPTDSNTLLTVTNYNDVIVFQTVKSLLSDAVIFTRRSSDGGTTWGDWAEVFSTTNVASTAEAEAGTIDDKPMTPLKTHQAFNQYGLSSRKKFIGAADSLAAAWYKLCDVSQYIDKTRITIIGGKFSSQGRGSTMTLEIGGASVPDEDKLRVFTLRADREPPFTTFRVVGTAIYAFGNQFGNCYIESTSTEVGGVVTPDFRQVTVPSGVDIFPINIFHQGNVASTADAEDGSADTVPMTPLKTHQAFNQYGLGRALGINVTDFNAVPDETGFYGVSTGTVTNGPSGANVSAAMLYHSVYDQNVASQILLSRVDQQIYYRTKSSGSWTSWRVVYGTNNAVGTVSQSGGTPTGAIIERGSNANGEYVKYADGTLIQQLEFTDAVSAGVKITKALPVTLFKQDFATAVVSIRPTGTAVIGDYIVWIESTSQVDFRTDVSYPSGNVHRVTVIGRWF